MLRSTISRSLHKPLCRQFSVSAAVGEHNVNRLGVIGAGQMVGWSLNVIGLRREGERLLTLGALGTRNCACGRSKCPDSGNISG